MSILARLFPTLFSYTREDSYIFTIRRKRLELIQTHLDQLCESVQPPVSMLDIGGELMFWKQSGFLDPARYHITLLNLKDITIPDDLKGFSAVQGDARSLDVDLCKGYDIAFSNSVIEHVGEDEDQAHMADLIKTHFSRYIVQTPNFWFPFEPHSQLPFFQFIPHSIRGAIIWLVGGVSYFPKKATYRECVAVSRSIRMLSKRKLRKLFPEATILTERMLGFPKSFIVIGGSLPVAQAQREE